MRVHGSEIEVFVSSHGSGNVYHRGEKAPLDSGLYCETVIDTQHELLVPNALNDPLWDKNPDIALGMISYLGLPLTWPGGKIFGTICILDQQENAHSQLTRDLLERFRDSIQSRLESICDASVERKQAEEALRESDKKVRRKLNAILSPETDISTLVLSLCSGKSLSGRGAGSRK